ncbi:MAG TPA: hypothetical protein DEA40_04300 [Parvularcula sp.]|nr:hypothetical protein [Parvularcula sp.]HBS35319.1 hypothetical protein [Parvularcula sp.]
MTLEEIYYVGQTIAVVALLISILFVGYQIRQNTKALKATSHHAITDSFNQINALIISDPKVARLWRLGMAGSADLSEDETTSFGLLALAYMRVFETLYYQHGNGTMERKLFEAELNTLKWAVTNPGIRAWWSANPISLSAEYRDFINGLIAEAIAGRAEEIK